MFVHPATHHFSRTYTSQNAGHPTTSRKNLNKENAGALPSKTPSRMTAKGLVPSTSIRVGLGVKSTIKDGNVQNGGGGEGKGKGKDEDIGKPCHAFPMHTPNAQHRRGCSPRTRPRPSRPCLPQSPSLPYRLSTPYPLARPLLDARHPPTCAHPPLRYSSRLHHYLPRPARAVDPARASRL